MLRDDALQIVRVSESRVLHCIASITPVLIRRAMKLAAPYLIVPSPLC